MSKINYNLVGKRTEVDMLSRKIESKINNWINSSHNHALLIYGVRQCGKTYIIRNCLQNSNYDFIEFNLITNPSIVETLEKSSSVDEIILRLSLLANKPITPGKTIIFFDEIQRYKEIVTMIKFLVEDGRYRYVMSGSLLGIEIVNLKSAPVGYLQSLTMYPLDFQEFLQIFNVNDDVIGLLENAYKSKIPVDPLIHKRIMQIFNLYLIIGGMPAAVEAYRTTNNIDNVIELHKNIVEQYKLDFTQYETDNRKLIISHIYDLIPSQLNEQNKRFTIADIDKNLRYEKITDSFTWLIKAGVVISVYNTTQPRIPLLINLKSNLFKLFLSDIGILTTIYGKTCKLQILDNNPDINKGAVYENYVAQELFAHGYPTYYYNSKTNGELDFVVEHHGHVLPIEVKSGKDYKRHSALNNVLNNHNYGINEAYVLCNNNLEVKDKITYLPIYMIMFLNEDIDEPFDISINKYMFK